MQEESEMDKEMNKLEKVIEELENTFYIKNRQVRKLRNIFNELKEAMTK